jgi:hypothetical protein
VLQFRYSLLPFMSKWDTLLSMRLRGLCVELPVTVNECDRWSIWSNHRLDRRACKKRLVSNN